MKLIGPVVFATIEKNFAGDLGGENLTGTLENGGVGIAPLDRTEAAWTAAFGSLVTADVIAKVEASRRRSSAAKSRFRTTSNR